MEVDSSERSISDDWIERHFDHLAPELARDLYPTLARARSRCPITHSDAHGGFWVATRYEDVLRTAQNWSTFSSELGITVPAMQRRLKILPVGIDPPLHREFKSLINVYFTPARIAPWEHPTRQLVNQLIDGFIERGNADFMAEFARPLPGLLFFDLALHAPADDLARVNDWATLASVAHTPEGRAGLAELTAWIGEFLDRRRAEPARGDVVDAVLNAQIEGRPITHEEATGTVQLLVLGGLETTAGVLGSAMLRFAANPEIPVMLRKHPELVPKAVEELLRLDGSFICVGRTSRHDIDIEGNKIAAGDPVILYWASANRDESEFTDPEDFQLDRPRNRHIAFGAGPHRCIGSNLARMNLRIAITELVRRLTDIRLASGTEVEFHSTYNRSPLSVPILFAPGPIHAPDLSDMATR